MDHENLVYEGRLFYTEFSIEFSCIILYKVPSFV